MSKRGRVWCAVLISAMVATAFAEARAADNRTLFIAREVRVPFAPEEAFFLVRRAGGETAMRVQAALLPIGANNETGRFMAAARIPHFQIGTIEYTVLVVGKANQLEVAAPIHEDIFERPRYLETADSLHDEITARREVLASYRLQVQTQEESLRRLRQDAEVIGNYGRVMEVSDDIERLRAEVSQVDRSMESLEALLRRASATQAAKGSLAREGVLTKQLSELAEAAKNSEAGEMARKAGMQAEVKQKLELIEATRFDDAEILRRQLGELRTVREQLEKGSKAGATVTAGPVSPETDY